MGGGAHRQSDRGALEQQVDGEQHQAAHRDHPEVAIADENAEHVGALGREGAWKRAGHVAEDKTRQAVQERRQAERDDDQGEDRRPLDRADDDPLDDDAATEREHERHGERDPVAHAAIDQGVCDERRQHRHLALGEVDQAHRVVDEDQRQREAREDAADREAADDLLEKFLHQ